MFTQRLEFLFFTGHSFTWYGEDPDKKYNTPWKDHDSVNDDNGKNKGKIPCTAHWKKFSEEFL